MSLRPHPLETLLTALAGWLPVLAGGALLGMTLVTPEWMGWRELLWQRDMLVLQSEGLAEQRASYAGFADALAADDPVLLERLALTQLRYKPVGKRLLDGVGQGFGPGVVEGEVVAVGNPGLANGQARSPGVIEAWLSTPQPVVGRDIEALKPMNTRLTRLTTGHSRFVLMGVGLVCLLVGLWPEKVEGRGLAGVVG